MMFCSTNCSSLFNSDVQSKAANKTPLMLAGPECPPPCRVHQYTSNMSTIAVHSLLLPPSSPTPSSSPPISFPPAAAITTETRPRMDSLKVKLKPRPRAVPGGEESNRSGKRTKCCRWRRWSFNITLSRGPCTPNEAVSMPTEEEVDVLLKKLGVCLLPDPFPKDERRCCFCNQQGDGHTDGPARLLNLDLDLWVSYTSFTPTQETTEELQQEKKNEEWSLTAEKLQKEKKQKKNKKLKKQQEKNQRNRSGEKEVEGTTE
ncbi:histone-lysine N-methyltransferase 2C-like [Notothenia coriiceps]|uniref:Histone-lysine N-methyltransferase 2C-like n=1 Tax=Notothenia coriiceps TaxID=8208 RepID=A0A6I9PIW2_9TELE|nr:PREDICTED: histone-lysine N-methyltransferase 2C-like [Notothenia coriiceps]